MSGPAVTIVDAGGVPVTIVSDGGVPVSLSDNGVPITPTTNATPVVLSGYIPPTPPAPGPLDFSTNDVGVTLYETEFGVAEPDIVLGLSFAYTGTPVISISHEGEALEVTTVLGSNGGYGVVFAVGRDLTVEDGNLTISVTGGSIGPFFGRVNELGYTPASITTQTYNQYMSTFTGNISGTGRLFLVSSTQWNTVFPTVQVPLELKSVYKDIGSSEVYDVLPPTGGAGLGWTYDAVNNRYSHTGRTTQSTPTDIDVFPPLSGTPLGWRVENVVKDEADPQLSTYFHSSVENRTQNIKSIITGQGDAVAYTTYGYDVDQSYARAVGNTSFENPKILVNPTTISGAIASSPAGTHTSFTYNNIAYVGTAMIVALIPEA